MCKYVLKVNTQNVFLIFKENKEAEKKIFNYKNVNKLIINPALTYT